MQEIQPCTVDFASLFLMFPCTYIPLCFSCSKSHIAQAGEQIVGVLALNRGVADKSRVNRDTLQQDLSLDCDGDLHIVLAFAEKIRAHTYIDVLGDPQLHSEAVIREFETF